MTTSATAASRSAHAAEYATTAASSSATSTTAGGASFGQTPAAAVSTQTASTTPGLYHDEWSFVMKTHSQMNALKKLEALPTPSQDQQVRIAQLKAKLTSEAPDFANMEAEAKTTMDANAATTCTIGGHMMEAALKSTSTKLSSLLSATAAAATDTSTS